MELDETQMRRFALAMDRSLGGDTAIQSRRSWDEPGMQSVLRDARWLLECLTEAGFRVIDTTESPELEAF